MKMKIDKLEEINIQDLMWAKVLGVSEKEVEELSLFQMKNKLQNKAWNLESNNIKITQEEADSLNEKFQEVMYSLQEISDIDFSADYWIDFDSYVDDDKPKRFSYIPCEGYIETLK